MALDTSYQNVAQLIQSKVRKEVNVTSNALEKFFRVGTHKGIGDAVPIQGPIDAGAPSFTENLQRIQVTDSQGDPVATDFIIRPEQSAYKDRNSSSPAEDNLIDTQWRVRRSRNMAKEFTVKATRAEAQTLGRSNDALIEMKSKQISTEYHRQMLWMMILGLDSWYTESPGIRGIPSANANVIVPFAPSYRHICIDGSPSMAADNAIDVPFTHVGLDWINAEMDSVREAGYLEYLDRNQAWGSSGGFDTSNKSSVNPNVGNRAITEVSPSRTASNTGVPIGLAETETPARLVIMTHSGFAAWRETNANVLGGSDIFNSPSKFLSHGRLYRYGDFGFLTVPDYMIDPVPNVVRSGGRQQLDYHDFRPDNNGISDRSNTSGANYVTTKAISDGARNQRAFNAVFGMFVWNDRNTNGTFRGLNNAASAEQTKGANSRDVTYKYYQSSDKLGSAVPFSDVLTFPGVGSWANATAPILDAVKRAGGTVPTSGNNARRFFSGKKLLENSYNNYCLPGPDMFMAYVVDIRAMHYSFPKELNVRMATQKDKDHTFEHIFYMNYNLGACRLYDPLVRTVHFTRPGVKGGFYKTT